MRHGLFLTLLFFVTCSLPVLVLAGGQWHFHVTYQDQFRVGIVFQHPDNMNSENLELCQREFVEFQQCCLKYPGMSEQFPNGLERSWPVVQVTIYPELKLGPDGEFGRYEISRATLDFLENGRATKSISLEAGTAKKQFYNLVAYNLNLVVRTQ